MSRVQAPFVKWAGGKRRLVPFIVEHLGIVPDSSTETSSATRARLVEPFAGGAALSLAVGRRFSGVWLNDVNKDLINLYTQLQEAPEEYIRAAAALFTPETNNAEKYYRFRDEFNTTESPSRKAVLFLYLNRHGYNGLCRYNSAGEFNVPYGRYKSPYFPVDELMAAAEVLQNARLTSVDFEDVLAACGPGDIVYCDPPYVPLSATASFTDYAAGGFDLADQRRLVAAAEAARRRGALVAISNHDNEITRELYRGAECHYRQVRRTISCDGQNRHAVTEVLAVYRPDTLPK